MYELDAHSTLSSARYLAHLNAPSPWSTKMMPHHRNMVRSQCHVLASFGGNVARHALVIRLSPAPGADAALLAATALRPDALVGLGAPAGDTFCAGFYTLAFSATPAEIAT